ncbi:MAG: GIY-YIG nuclease family protein, partial [Anaerolineales bacterium]
MMATSPQSHFEFPARRGLYVLICAIDDPVTLDIGRLGRLSFAAGSYAYVGSARGPGGLAARLNRHLRPPEQKQTHWHIDYLLARAQLQCAAWAVEPHSSECEWSDSLADLGARWPRRFGASDCRCEGHMIGLDPQTS